MRSERLGRYVRQPAKSKRLRCCRSEVDYSAGHKRATVIDPHEDAVAVALIRDTHARAKR
jgi:hypothetical protein